MNDVGESSKFVFSGYFVVLPVIREFITGFLTHHSLLNPLFASAVLLPVFTGTVKGTGGIAHILQSFRSNLCQP